MSYVRSSTANPTGWRPWQSRLSGLGAVRRWRRGDRFSALGDATTSPTAGLGVPAINTPDFWAFASGFYGAQPDPSIDPTTLPGYSRNRNAYIYASPALYQRVAWAQLGKPDPSPGASQVASNFVSPSAAADFGMNTDGTWMARYAVSSAAPTPANTMIATAVAPSGQAIQAPPSTAAAAGSQGAVAPSTSLPSWIPSSLTQPVNIPIVGSVPLVYLIGAGAAALLLFAGGGHHHGGRE
jgi:hypothetical protein